MDTLGFILIAIVGAALGALGRVSFRRIRRSDIERRPIRRRIIVLLVLALIVIFLVNSLFILRPENIRAPSTDTLVSVQEHAGGNWTTYAMKPPPYIVMTNASGQSTVLSWPQNYTAGETTQIDLQRSNITVTMGSNIEKVVPYAAGQPLNVTISSALRSFSLSTFSEIRVTPPAIPSPTPTPSPTPSPQNWWQSLQDSISANLLAYTGYFASFIGVGYFARDITLRIKRLV